MKTTRIALSIRAQLLLVLTVFLALPWLGVEYVRELERVLRDAQERTLAGTAQAVATALHDRPRLFAHPPDPIASFARERAEDTGKGSPTLPPSASPEIAQIIEGLSRTTARIWVIDRDGTVLARAGTLRTVPPQAPPDSLWQRIGRATIGRLYALVLEQPTEDFSDDAATQGAPRGRDVEGALAGILSTERRPTSDGKATVVSAAHPIWVSDQVRGAVIAEETGNAVLAERNRAFERLFNIVLAVLLIGSLALTGYATWLSSRIRRLRDDAERAIDEQGRVREPLASSDAGDEIGDLSRSFSSVLARLSDYASYQEKMASRLSHELRTPVAVVRSSLENLAAAPVPDDARIYMTRAQEGLTRLTQILTRMTEAARLEQGLSEVDTERFDIVPVVAGCVAGYRLAYPQARLQFNAPTERIDVRGSPDLIAQLLDKLAANAIEFAVGAPIEIRVERHGNAVHLVVANEGPSLPEGMHDRLFESMVSVRAGGDAGVPHLGLGLYIVRVIAQFHGGTVRAANRPDVSGVMITVVLPMAGRD
jgi:two-component system, OmpR family, sensor histidine kinase ChvG